MLGLWSYTVIRYGVENDATWAIPTGVTLGTFAAFTWASNVVGAVRGARRANQHRLHLRADDILRALDHPDVERSAEDALSARDF